ncbi:MAG: ABC transporter permease [Chthonomonadetes bacterium]|nr:ABC transporter permease [Chthonomonadetes bacterium]
MKAIYDFCFTWSREAQRFLTDWRLVAVLLIVPLLYTVLFGELYSQHRVMEIPCVVQDNDHSPLSRQIIQSIDATDTFDVRGSVHDLQQFRRLNWQGKAFVCIVIPRGLQRDVSAGKQARVLAVIDGSNMIIANAATRSVSEVLQTYSVGISLRKCSARGIPPQHTGTQAMPIETGLRLWYNPTFNYTNFLLLGLVGAILQQVVLLAVALSWAKEHEQNTLVELRSQITHPVAAALGKMVFYVMASFVMSILVFMLPFGKFGVPMHGNAGVLLATTAFFIIGLVGFGVFISSVTLSQLLSTQILMLIAVPSFLLSGFTWPLFAMPDGIRWLAQVLPLTHYLAVVRNTVSNGAGWAHNMAEIKWLFGFATLGTALQTISVWWRLSTTSATKTLSEGEYAGVSGNQQATDCA